MSELAPGEVHYDRSVQRRRLVVLGDLLVPLAVFFILSTDRFRSAPGRAAGATAS